MGLPNRIVCMRWSMTIPRVAAGGDLAVGTDGTKLALSAGFGERVTGALVGLGGVLLEPQASIDLWYAKGETLTHVKSEPGRRHRVRSCAAM